MHLAPGVANISPLAPGRSVDGGNLPIDELLGVKAVESIDFSGRGLSTMSAIIIGACIAGNRHLRELKLVDNSLGDEGWGAIFAAVCGSRISKITSIDASSGGISPEGAKLIGKALRNSVNASVTSVRASIGW